MSAAPATPRRSSAAGEVSRPTWEEDVSWQQDALCRGADVNLFFTPSHLEHKEEREEREDRAKAICAGCPVRNPCLSFALRTREPHGVWGGMNEIERRHLLLRREKRAG